MSKKKEKMLSEKIAELMAPRRLLDPEIDSEDETAAKTVDFDLDESNANEVTVLSDIRKRNVKLLHSIDEKYRGKLASRKDFEGASDDENEGVEDDSEDNDEPPTNGEPEQPFSMRLKPSLDLSGVPGDDEFEPSDDDADELQTFSAQLKRLSADKKRMHAAKKDEDDMNDDESGDDDSLVDDDEHIIHEESDIAEEMVEEEDESEGTDDTTDDASDEEEMDYDADISYASTSQTKELATEKPDSSKSILPKAQAQNQMKKGNAVQNQLQIWEKLLEVRIHSQKMLIKANSLPTSAKFQKLSTENADFAKLAEETEKNVTGLLSRMCEMQNALFNQFSETQKFATKTSKRRLTSQPAIREDEVNGCPENKRCRWAEDLGDSFAKFSDYRNSVISKWHDRTRVLTPGKKSQQQTDFDVVRKIEGVLNNKVELVRKTQLLKGGYELFDIDDGVQETIESNANANADEYIAENNVESNTSGRIYCTEIYDDTDFYHTQLRELIEYKTNMSSNANDMAKQFVELQKLRKKMKKRVDTRASKGRKIRYVLHNKLVNFMAPNEASTWTDESKTELYRSLFGASAQ